MTFKEVSLMIKSIGLPYSYYQFDNDTAVAPPFVVFYYPESDDMQADGQNYQKIEALNIELYTDSKDFVHEKAVEDELKANGLTWSRFETYIESEKLYMVTFETSIIVKEEKNNG